MMIYAALLIGLGWAFVRLPGGFLPIDDQGFITTDVQTPADASYNRTQAAVEKVEKYLADKPGVEDVTFITGYSFLGQGLNTAQAFITLKDWSERKNPSQHVGAIARRAMPVLVEQTFGDFHSETLLLCMLLGLRVTEVPVQVAESEQSGSTKLFARRVFNSSELAVWTRQLSGLVVAGLPLERALTALADEAEDPRQRELVAHLRAEVNAGSPFARALGGAQREFDEVYRGVVAAGEQSGQLGGVLDKLANDLEEQQALKSKLIGATLYPATRPSARSATGTWLSTAG